MRKKRSLSEEHKRKISASHLAPSEGSFKQCRICHQILPIADFSKAGSASGRHRTECKLCGNAANREYHHQTGCNRPMEEAKESSAYLGVHVAERALSIFFDHIERMPYGNPGYDFICGKGFKIDVKSSCKYLDNTVNGYWQFTTKCNSVADYFLCLAFDDRNGLNPMHVWLIPSDLVSNKRAVYIWDSERSLLKWRKYERPLDKVVVGCNILRGFA